MLAVPQFLEKKYIIRAVVAKKYVFKDKCEKLISLSFVELLVHFYHMNGLPKGVLRRCTSTALY